MGLSKNLSVLLVERKVRFLCTCGLVAPSSHSLIVDGRKTCRIVDRIKFLRRSRREPFIMTKSRKPSHSDPHPEARVSALLDRERPLCFVSVRHCRGSEAEKSACRWTRWARPCRPPNAEETPARILSTRKTQRGSVLSVRESCELLRGSARRGAGKPRHAARPRPSRRKTRIRNPHR